LIFVAHIRFAKSGGDLGPSAGLPRSHGIKSNAPGSAGALRRGESRGAPTSSPSLPCFCESASGGNQIRHTVASGFALRYARYIADAEINGFCFARRTLTAAINTVFMMLPQ